MFNWSLRVVHQMAYYCGCVQYSMWGGDLLLKYRTEGNLSAPRTSVQQHTYQPYVRHMLQSITIRLWYCEINFHTKVNKCSFHLGGSMLFLFRD